MHQATMKHCLAVKRVLYYFKETLTHEIVIHKTTSFSCTAFPDYDWDDNNNDITFTSAYIMSLGAIQSVEVLSVGFWTK